VNEEACPGNVEVGGWLRTFTVRALKFLLFLLLVAQPVWVYLVRYVDKDCDDKAVHFYAAASLFGPGEKVRAIRANIREWSRAEEEAWRRQRFVTRMTGATNYMAADVFIKAIRMWQLRGGRGPEEAPYYSWAVRIAFFCMLILAFGNLLVAGWRSPPGIWFVLVAANLVAFTVIRVPVLVSGPRDTMHSFISYVPRGSATLFVPAMFLLYAAGRRVHFAFSGCMLYLWHGGMSILMFAVMLPLLLIVDRLSARFARDGAEGPGIGLVERFIYPVVILLLCSCAVLVARASAFPLPESVVSGATREELPAAWSCAVYVAFYLGLAYACLKSGIVDVRDRFGSRFVLVSAGFVALCGVCGMLVASEAARAAMERVSGSQLVYEIPKRLSGARYLVQSTLIAFVVLSVARRCARVRISLAGGRRKALAVGAVMAVMLAAGITLRAVVNSNPRYDLLGKGKTSFFRDDECEHVKAVPVTAETLADLDPLQEPEFFYSLGEWLMAEGVVSGP